MPTIVYHSNKRRELFDPDKLHASLMQHSLANRVPEGKAEDTAGRVVSNVERWISRHASVTAKDIRRVAAKSLEVFDKDLAESYASQDSII